MLNVVSLPTIFHMNQSIISFAAAFLDRNQTLVRVIGVISISTGVQPPPSSSRLTFFQTPLMIEPQQYYLVSRHRDAKSTLVMNGNGIGCSLNIPSPSSLSKERVRSLVLDQRTSISSCELFGLEKLVQAQFDSFV
jgi:hypothetical protein